MCFADNVRCPFTMLTYIPLTATTSPYMSLHLVELNGDMTVTSLTTAIFVTLNVSVGHAEQETVGCQNVAFGHFLQ